MNKRKLGKHTKKALSLVAVGDICLAGRVNEMLRVSDPFEFVRNDIAHSDISIGNLECVITDKGKPSAYKFKWGRRYGLKLRTSPLAINYLKIFTILSFANNHTLDLGIEGMNNTLDVLRRNGILTQGAGKNYQQAIRPLIIESNSLKIGFISFVYSFVRDETPLFSTLDRAHRFNRPGPARYFEKDVMNYVRRLKDETDFIIASIHWGASGIDYPSPPQRSLAERLIDHGVNIIIGHHPHVVQGIQKHRNGLIFYSLGNFIFDTVICPQETGLMVRLSLSPGKILRYNLTPIDVNDYLQPVKLIEKDSFRRHMQDISRPLSYSFSQYYEFWRERLSKVYLDIWSRAARVYLRPFFGLPHAEKLYASFIRGLTKSKCGNSLDQQ